MLLLGATADSLLYALFPIRVDDGE